MTDQMWLAVGFVFLRPEHANAFLQRWKPQVLAGELVCSHTTLDMYTKARICLENSQCVGALCSEKSIFVLTRKEGQLFAMTFVTERSKELDTCRELRLWFQHRSEFIYGDPLPDNQKEYWDLSAYES